MFPRLLAVAISGFWIVMWALLLRTEWQPRDDAWKSVPVEHVLKLMFHHQQASELFLKGENERIGHLRLQPRIRAEDGKRLIEISGAAQIRIPGVDRQRLTWEGASEFSPQLAMERVRLRTVVYPIGMRAAGADNTVDVDIDLVNKQIAYAWLTGNEQQRGEYPLSEEGLRKFAEEMGMDLGMLDAVKSQATNSEVALTAQQSHLILHGERLDALLVSLRQNQQTWLELYVSQLGQILQVKTLTGWTLDPQ